MKNYTAPKMDIIKFDAADVVLASGPIEVFSGTGAINGADASFFGALDAAFDRAIDQIK